MARLKAPDGHWVVRILCALALLFAGLVHKPPTATAASAAISDAMLANYILPDGTMPVLCLPSQLDDTGHQTHELGSPCDVCRLSASVILPSPPEVTQRLPLTESARPPATDETVHRPFFPRDGFARGPPQA